jgi:PD-(D/E)XK nuclease superfamily protein
MTYSYTQISQYLSCPRRYRHHYLDGWQEKDTRAPMLFGRAFEQAVAALFRREDPAAVLFEQWGLCKDMGLTYSGNDTWDRMLQQGIQLLERFAQDDRIRIRRPRSTQQVQFNRTLGTGSNFVAYVDAVGELDGTPCLLEWKTTSARYPEEPAGISALDPQLVCYSWMTGIDEVSPGCFRPQASGRSAVSPRHDHSGATPGVCGIGRRYGPTNRVWAVPAAQRYPLSTESVHHVPVHRTLLRQARSGRGWSCAQTWSRSWSV